MKKIILCLGFLCGLSFADELADCEAGNIKACHNIGVEHYEKGEFEKALEFFKKGCDGRASKSCFAISEMYHSGNGVKRSMHEAIIYVEKACDESDDPENCDKMDRY
ncbi:tetratricopeptide repeat protein [Campylobacter corcagiensis]|uniref:beta-lactamase n=1 Tax=Campylobacter corcagiensis TaxID=1448857 RepID=A0A7M1LGT1_9BACT|nr:sel1 repeat family protein [Campylobacter corcagiensis]QKF63987.1 Sel1 domain-containing protein [Campylobacter corcagiensis]QOQ87809.1 sel1 repeat family protein [Campylobacter corcagiensis]